MKNERLRQGDIVAYSYRWHHETFDEIENPKDRPACIALFMKGQKGQNLVALLAISDQLNKDKALSLELKDKDLIAAGLSTRRRAYIQLSEMNIDEVENSLSFSANAKRFGRVPESTLRILLEKLSEQLKAKNIALIHRGRNG
jgi:hypothetical protein